MSEEKLNEEDRVPLEMEVDAREMMVSRFGPRCAAWLVGAPWYPGGNARRAKLHRRGQVDVVVPDVDREGKTYEMPMWFSLAVTFLKARASWGVAVIRHRGERRYRIKWHGWMRSVPVSIARFIDG